VLCKFFGFETLNGSQFALSAGIGFVSVIWFELVKWRNRVKNKSAIFCSFYVKKN
jgi:P-type Ca2+ transporter type 2C